MKPLILVSSKTGNTRIIAHGVADEIAGAVYMNAADLPEDLSGFGPVGLFFWCDRGMAPEDMKAAAQRLSGKEVACFATMGGCPQEERALAWMRNTSEELAAAGEGNVLKGTFLCQGRIDPELIERMNKMFGNGKPDPARDARRKAAETHPDRLDVLAAVEAWRKCFG